MADDSGLSRVAARGAVYSSSAQAVRLASQVASMVLLARLLNPDDFGVVAIVVALVGFGEIIRDMGLSNAAIQAPKLSPAQRNTLFWINLSIGTLLAVAATVFAPLIAHIYGDPRLVNIVRALAITFLVNGLAAQYRASLFRDLKFRGVAIIDSVAAITSLLAALAVALADLQYWALVVQQLAYASVGAIGVIALGRWWPGRPASLRAVAPVLSQGFKLALSGIVTYFARSADVLVGGLRLSTAALGYYTRASSAVYIPLYQINPMATRVAVPILSKLQGQRERFRAYLLHGQGILLHFVLIVLAALTAFATPATRVILGPGWSPVVPILQILAIGSIPRVMTYATSWVALSVGLPKIPLYTALITAPVTALCAWFGSGAGAIGLAIAMGVANLCAWAVEVIAYRRMSDAPVGAMVRNALPLAAVYATTGVLGAIAWNGAAAAWGGAAALLSTALICASTILLSACLWPTYRTSLRTVWESRHILRAAR